MTNQYKRMKGFSDKLGSLIQYITVAITVFLLFLSTIQVFLRTFNLPQMGVEELMQFPVVWMYMLGGACASFTKSHIECGVLDSFIKKKKTLDIVGIIKTILDFIVCCITIKWAYDFLKSSISLNKLSVIFGFPWVIANAAFFVGLVAMAFFTVVEFIEKINAFKNHEEKEAKVCH